MKQIKMLTTFCECAKIIIPNIDENGLEYDFRHNEIDFDEQGPICSDHKLLEIFENNILLTQNELYQLIEKICLEYVIKIHK